MLPASLLFSCFFLLASSVTALSPSLDPYQTRPHIPYVDEPDESISVLKFGSNKQISSHHETYYFEQLIDHRKPSLGTFKQRYWHSYEFYEPGGPIVLCTPGEVNAAGFTGYLTNSTIVGMIAQPLKGATIVLEHRFFGESNPYSDLSVQSLQVHTIEQAIEDLAYFAKNVKLPMPGGDNVAPGKAAWILVGGSYPGALVSYAMHSKPDVFWAAYSSSGVVQSIGHFWGYFEPIREHMPKNCSADVETVINYVDAVIDTGNKTAIKAMKDIFGLGDIQYDDDFASAMKIVMNYWQDGLIGKRSEGFYWFCDSLEVDNGKAAPESGWGFDHALKAWGKFWKDQFYKSACGTRDAEACFGNHNANSTKWNQTALSDGRSWKWMTCNEFGFFPTGAPAGRPTIVSRHLTPEFSERSCDYDFPGAFNGHKRFSLLNALDVNVKYGGWNVTTERLIFVNGQRDPWREATVAANGALFSPNEMQPHLITDGFHCSDMMRSEGLLSPHVKAAQDAAVGYMTKWFKDWHPTS
ncbi:peptidase S28 [Daedaleopsis nitida]|nr:peptidase S28 [Daedaleopsis nitida]